MLTRAARRASSGIHGSLGRTPLTTMAASAQSSSATTGVVDATQELSKKGAFVRTESQFRDALGSDKYPVEAGRYHLYVSYACPWACRCLMVRNLKGLQDAIGVSVVHPVWVQTKPGVDEHRGWGFGTDFAGADGDPIYGAATVRDLYERLAGGQKVTKFTVPMLVDTKTDTIVNNESSEIIRMLTSVCDSISSNPGLDLYPAELREAIDAVNAWVYPKLNNGVYRSGFATTQEAYDEAVAEVFEALDDMEEILSKQRWLAGDGKRFTEADLRAFVTIVRFDAVYVTHFKCNRKTIREYPNITDFMREIYQMPGISDTVDLDHIRHHYQRSHPSINKYGIVAVCPDPLLDAPHDRARFPQA
ncbi:hypothetical protein FNF27_04794 [Cafeteria roenbergensis]|uniref:GST C-terminal domain-containing protein n=1 Tax=Cafeteria roenbergensis TaxID=33653 RepID=A0A5A8CCI0_CAFRO|nr:hypothetical protein FNF29_05381 [Cafeteria roenbergensis]KAA0160698.1 hypothetical protein FNF28_05334 [Cafeteria roenbergensis]KAA0173644.1 hypothetical protein FNF27_04794 [Cafeteria roenbergensis]|eukprot:KAA0150369.1 hypothetical protein FNF29_05381 [Cafeteria roenbergensis]